MIILARWILILAGMAITIWSPAATELERMRITFVALFCLSAMNFYLQAQLLMRQPIPRELLYLASGTDLIVVSVMTWTQGGLDARTFVYFYPALLAFALVFQGRVTCSFAGAIIIAYAAVASGASTRDGSAQDVMTFVVRALSLAGVAVIGHLYQRVQGDRARLIASGQTGEWDFARRAQDDLFYGQLVLIVARWFLIGAGVTVCLWSADNVQSMSVAMLGMMVLMSMNFFLHARYLMQQPVRAPLIYLAGLTDVAVVLSIAGMGGFASSTPQGTFFVLLYPLLLAFGLVFPPSQAIAGATTVIALYATMVWKAHGLDNLGMQKALAGQLITLAATAGLGTWFWRIQHAISRSDAMHEDTMDDLARTIDDLQPCPDIVQSPLSSTRL